MTYGFFSGYSSRNCDALDKGRLLPDSGFMDHGTSSAALWEACR